jgi:hypothetical protein
VQRCSSWLAQKLTLNGNPSASRGESGRRFDRVAGFQTGIYRFFQLHFERGPNISRVASENHLRLKGSLALESDDDWKSRGRRYTSQGGDWKEV